MLLRAGNYPGIVVALDRSAMAAASRVLYVPALVASDDRASFDYDGLLLYTLSVGAE